MSDATHLVWVDLETNGGYQDTDVEIMEMYARITPIEYSAWSETYGEFHKKYHLSVAGSDNLLRNSFVREMHLENGLLKEIYDMPGNRTAHAFLATEFINWLRPYFKKGYLFQWAGSGIATFDIPLLKNLGVPSHSYKEWFVYSVLDIGHVRRMLKMAGASPEVPRLKENSIPHRAKDDIDNIILEATAYMEAFSVYI